jgi:hypothetical protein
MESIVPDSPRPLECAIDGACDPNRKAHEAAREGAFVGGLDEQVQVIGLHGKMHEAKPGPCRSPERTTNCEKHDLTTQARQASRRA